MRGAEGRRTTSTIHEHKGVWIGSARSPWIARGSVSDFARFEASNILLIPYCRRTARIEQPCLGWRERLVDQE